MTTTPKRDAAADLAQQFADYVPSLEGRDIVTIRPAYGLVIDGEERPAEGGSHRALTASPGAPRFPRGRGCATMARGDDEVAGAGGAARSGPARGRT